MDEAWIFTRHFDNLQWVFRLAEYPAVKYLAPAETSFINQNLTVLPPAVTLRVAFFI
jgi:hypothetical protein